MLAYSDRRLAEALVLTAGRVDLKAHALTCETLKKRKRGVWRTVPVPPDLRSLGTYDGITIAAPRDFMRRLSMPEYP